MRFKNNGSVDVILTDLRVPGFPPAGSLIQAGSSYTVYDSDAKKSDQLAALITATTFAKVSDVEPSTANGVGPTALRLEGAGAPTSGTSGTGHGWAAIGSLYTDYTNGALYVNIGTSASPTWKSVLLSD